MSRKARGFSVFSLPRQIKHLKIALVVRPAVVLAQPVQLTPWLPEGGTGPSPPQPRRGFL